MHTDALKFTLAKKKTFFEDLNLVRQFEETNYQRTVYAIKFFYFSDELHDLLTCPSELGLVMNISSHQP